MKSINLIVSVIAILLLSVTAQAGKRNSKCKQKMEQAKDTAYNIGFAHYMSTGDEETAKRQGISYLKKVCRSYCKGVRQRYGRKKITCRERINSNVELDAILSKVHFEEEIAEEKRMDELDI